MLKIIILLISRQWFRKYPAHVRVTAINKMGLQLHSFHKSALEGFQYAVKCSAVICTVANEEYTHAGTVNNHQLVSDYCRDYLSIRQMNFPYVGTYCSCWQANYWEGLTSCHWVIKLLTVPQPKTIECQDKHTEKFHLMVFKGLLYLFV